MPHLMCGLISRAPKGAPRLDKDKLDIPQGTLDLMILTILTREPMHGDGISTRLTTLSRGPFQINPGSLFPSLYRLDAIATLTPPCPTTPNTPPPNHTPPPPSPPLP